MKNSLFIIPMLAPMMLISSASANLPDEINYPPYQRTYEISSQKVDSITANLNRAKEELQTAYNNEANLTAVIERLEIDISRTNNQVQDFVIERDNLIVDSQNLDAEILNIDNRLSRAEGRRAEFERTAERARKRLRPFKQKLKVLEAELDRANRDVTNANKRLRALKAAKDQAKSAVDSARVEVTRLENQLKTQEATLANIDTLITNAEKRIANLKSQRKAKNDAKKATQEKVDALNIEIVDLQTELRALGRTSPEAREVRAKIRMKVGEKTNLDKELARVTNEVRGINSNINTTKTQLTTLQGQKTTLPRTIENTKAQISTAKNNVKNKQDAFKTARANVAVQETEVNSLVTAANSKSAEVSAQKEEVIRRSVPLNEAMADIQRVNQRIRNIGERLRDARANYKRVVDRIDYLDNEIPRLRRSAGQMNREIRSANSDLIVTQDQIVTLNSDVTMLSSELRGATNDRDIKYSDYIARYNLYSDKLSEAKMIGASQTDAALSIARADSNNFVETRANQLGQIAGSELAKAQGELWGFVRAEIKGYNDGHNIGYSSADDQARGMQEGTMAGETAARDYAQSVLKPKYFNEIFNDALKNGKIKAQDSVQIQAAAIQKEHNASIIKNVMDFFSSVSPLTTNELNQSDDIKTDLDHKIATAQVNLQNAETQETGYANPGNAYVKPAKIPFENVNCSAVYKDLPVFEKACATEYEDIFASKYMNEHIAVFNDTYTANYNDKVAANREAMIEGIYNKAMNDAYPIAKAAGVSDGKDQIYQETYALAKNEAYNNELPKADAVAKAQAGNEVQTWVNNNASIIVTKAEIEATNLRGGSTAKIKMDIKNISPKDLTKPVEVVITGTQNAVVSQRSFYINNAKANTTTVKNDMTFQVNPNATSGAPIKIEGVIKLPGGKYNAVTEQKFSVESVTQVNPKLSYNGNEYDSSPKIRNWRGRSLVHRMDTNIAAAVEDIRDGYTVTLNPIAGFENLITLKNTSAFTGKMTRGTNNKMSFSYYFPKSADGKLVKLEMKYIFKGQVMKTEVIELRPH